MDDHSEKCLQEAREILKKGNLLPPNNKCEMPCCENEFPRFAMTTMPCNKHVCCSECVGSCYILDKVSHVLVVECPFCREKSVMKTATGVCSIKENSIAVQRVNTQIEPRRTDALVSYIASQLPQRLRFYSYAYLSEEKEAHQLNRKLSKSQVNDDEEKRSIVAKLDDFELKFINHAKDFVRFETSCYPKQFGPFRMDTPTEEKVKMFIQSHDIPLDLVSKIKIVKTFNTFIFSLKKERN